MSLNKVLSFYFAICMAVGMAQASALMPEPFTEMVPMPDGTRLYTCAIRPKDGEKRPVIVTRSPYVEEKPMSMGAFTMFCAVPYMRGYTCVFQHCRGCGMSEGEWVPYESERADGLALLDWIRAQPWYNGEIFLVGGSYHTAAHWAYLDMNPPDVKGAVLPTHDVDRYCGLYRNGFLKTGLFEAWTVHFYKKKDRSLKRDKSVSPRDFPLCDFPRRYWGVDEPVFANVLAHPRRDDPFWLTDEPGAGGSMRNAFTKSTMPILLITSAYDMFSDGICNMWREAPRERLANCSLLIDAYDHDGQCKQDMKGTLGEFPRGARIQNPARLLDWFDYCRTGKPCKFAPLGKVRYYALWENRWIEEETLADGRRRVDFPLGKGTRSWKYDPKRPPPDFPGACGFNFGSMRTQPRPDFRDDVVSFLLPPVSELLDVRGRMRARLSVASDCEDTCFYVRVSVKKSDGKWYLLRDDVTSLSANGGDYVPGSERFVEFRFPDLAFRLEKGDAMRVDVSSASSQFAPHGNVKGNQNEVREPKTARNSVRADASTLTLFVKEKASE